ncbi:hypothetical protein FDX11_00960 [Citrobacter sp. wls714]|nr:hypothetical protein FDX11_00960 [Citrobacter sp. wls714]
MLIMPIDVYLANSFNIIKISKFLEAESLAFERGSIDISCWWVRQKWDTKSFALVCKALHVFRKWDA